MNVENLSFSELKALAKNVEFEIKRREWAAQQARIAAHQTMVHIARWHLCRLSNKI